LGLFDRLIKDLKTGKKLQPNGHRLSDGSIRNYEIVRKNLWQFSNKTGIKLRIRELGGLTARERLSQRNYWKRLYISFSDYLYDTKDCHDNYVGSQMKIIRAFLNYLKQDLFIDTGNYRALLYIPKEEIPVIALSVEQLQFLIHSDEFHNALPEHLKKTKDIFIIGCLTALRFSDLMNLTTNNLKLTSSGYYLSVRSIKTKCTSSIPLPCCAIEILNKYALRQKTLLPKQSLSNFGLNMKEIAEKAGWTHPIEKWREKRGVAKVLKLKKKHYRFCDLVSSHTMRKTAISTMVEMGVAEHIVRNISGHAPGSKEFYRYVSISQAKKDEELDKLYLQLKNYKVAKPKYVMYTG